MPRGEHRSKAKKRVTRSQLKSVYMAKGTRIGCGGQDCSWYKLKPCAQQKLVNIVPRPPGADVARVTLSAKVELRNQLADMLRALKALVQAGEPFALMIDKILHGFGGQDVCDLYPGGCECEHDKGTPPEVWTGPPFVLPIGITCNGVAYTANFELRAELEILHAHCDDTF